MLQISLSKINSRQKKINELEKENKKLTEELKTLETELETLEDLNISLRYEIKELNQENDGIRNDLEYEKKEKDDAYLEIKSLERAVVELTEELQDFIGYS